jgi:hypothetical protein
LLFYSAGYQLILLTLDEDIPVATTYQVYCSRCHGDTGQGLSDQHVVNVLTYVLTGLNPNRLPADFEPISADEVKAERQAFNAAAIHAERDSMIKELGQQGREVGTRRLRWKPRAIDGDSFRPRRTAVVQLTT